jgi:hypothetical protein
MPNSPTASSPIGFTSQCKTLIGEIGYIPRQLTSDEISWLANSQNSLSPKFIKNSTLMSCSF